MLEALQPDLPRLVLIAAATEGLQVTRTPQAILAGSSPAGPAANG